MNALDIYAMCRKQLKAIAAMEETLERRRALALSCTTRPLSAEGAAHGGGDASMRMLDFVADVEALESKIAQERERLSAMMSCAAYISGRMSARAAELLEYYYLGGRTVAQTAALMHLSGAYVKGLKAQAEAEAAAVTILSWDGRHMPILAD